MKATPRFRIDKPGQKMRNRKGGKNNVTSKPLMPNILLGRPRSQISTTRKGHVEIPAPTAIWGTNGKGSDVCYGLQSKKASGRGQAKRKRKRKEPRRTKRICPTRREAGKMYDDFA